jgi:hypothetical protein
MIVEIREEARGDLHVGYRFYEEQAAVTAVDVTSTASTRRPSRGMSNSR